MALITGLAHINLTIPANAESLDLAQAFYADTLGLTPIPVPSAQRSSLAWYSIGESTQQVHISHAKHDQDTLPANSSRHPCFKIDSPENLVSLQQKIYAHYEQGGQGAPMAADKPGQVNSGSQGTEYPTRFFARDFAGNRLEFSL